MVPEIEEIEKEQVVEYMVRWVRSSKGVPTLKYDASIFLIRIQSVSNYQRLASALLDEEEPTLGISFAK